MQCGRNTHTSGAKTNRIHRFSVDILLRTDSLPYVLSIKAHMLAQLHDSSGPVAERTKFK